MDISKKYQKLTPIEHILMRPGMYIGSKDKIEQNLFVFDQQTNKIINKTISYIPGLYKIYDELIVNAYDQTIRDPTVTSIKINIDLDKNEISVENDGKGIDVVIHPEHKIYIPELIFGQLLTSTSFSDDESTSKITGGIHGLGAKLTNIFSTFFQVQVGDSVNKKKFSQIYKNNLSNKSKPVITNYNKPNGYVKITFQPDLQYFKSDKLDNDIYGLMLKRIYGINSTSRHMKPFTNIYKYLLKMCLIASHKMRKMN
jgi:DNA topoisomerase-2